MALPPGGTTSSPLISCPITDDPFSSIDSSSINITSSSPLASASSIPVCAFNYPVPLDFTSCCAAGAGGVQYTDFCTQFCVVTASKAGVGVDVQNTFQQCAQGIADASVVNTSASNSWGGVVASCEDLNASGEGKGNGSGIGEDERVSSGAGGGNERGKKMLGLVLVLVLGVQFLVILG